MKSFNLLSSEKTTKKRNISFVLLFLLLSFNLIAFLYYFNKNENLALALENEKENTDLFKENIKEPETIPILSENPVIPVLPPGTISLQKSHADIRVILQDIAMAGSANLILHESVQGTLSVDFKQIAWEKALDAVLKAGHLIADYQNNMIFVLSKADQTKRLQSDIDQQHIEESLLPLSSDIISLHYAKASDVENVFTQNKTEWLSNRGILIKDERTNTLLIKDTLPRLTAIKKMIQSLDIPIKQVAIEARIMNVEKGFSKELGLLWEAEANISLENASTLMVGTLTHQALIYMELQALENEHKIEELAHPRLITSNQKTAIIRQGEEIPYQQSGEYGVSTINFKPAVLELQVTPHITSNNHILLELIIKNDTRGLQPLADNIPVITTKEIRTQVLAQHGQTIVLGGIYTQVSDKQQNKLPLASSLPLVGSLFNNTKRSKEQKELIVLVTPRILGDI